MGPLNGWLDRLKKRFLKDESKADLNEQQQKTSVATPNHSLANDGAFEAISLRQSSLPMQAISSVPSIANSIKKVQKNTAVWKRDQQAMASGQYAFSAGFSAKYRLKELLGEGSFGFVFVASSLSHLQGSDGDEEVAVKFILRDRITPSQWVYDSSLRTLIPSEVYWLKQARHENIVGFRDCFLGDARYVYLVTELHGVGWGPNPRLDRLSKNTGLRPFNLALEKRKRLPMDLFECIEAHTMLPLGIVKKILMQLVSVLLYLHEELGVAHRDLKDENIAVDEDYRIKLLDFGSAVALAKGDDGEGWLDRFQGTVAFAAPEIVRGERYRASKAEVWTLGILLYTMVYGRGPFASPDAILHQQLRFPMRLGNERDYEEVKRLMESMLDKDAEKRIGLRQIANHPFSLTQ